MCSGFSVAACENPNALLAIPIPCAISLGEWATSGFKSSPTALSSHLWLDRLCPLIHLANSSRSSPAGRLRCQRLKSPWPASLLQRWAHTHGRWIHHPPSGQEGRLRAAFQESNLNPGGNCPPLRELAVLLGHSCRSRVRLTSPDHGPQLTNTGRRGWGFLAWHSAFFPTLGLLHGETHACFYTTMKKWRAHFLNFLTWSQAPSGPQLCVRILGSQKNPSHLLDSFTQPGLWPAFQTVSWQNPISPTHIVSLARNVHSDKLQPRKKLLLFKQVIGMNCFGFLSNYLLKSKTLICMLKYNGLHQCGPGSDSSHPVRQEISRWSSQFDFRGTEFWTAEKFNGDFITTWNIIREPHSLPKAEENASY